MSNNLSVGCAWTTFVARPGVFTRFWIRRLEHAYRAPSLFASKMRDAGSEITVLVCDEELKLDHLDGTVRTLPEMCDLFYISTHGVFDSKDGYTALLHASDWRPGAAGLDRNGPIVAVFDTCFLIDGTKQWSPEWENAKLGYRVRLILGFDGLAAIDRGNALRGQAFAENVLKGQPFSEAWIRAVHDTTPRYGKAVAIAVGDNPADALTVLLSASMRAMPEPRSSQRPVLAWRY